MRLHDVRECSWVVFVDVITFELGPVATHAVLAYDQVAGKAVVFDAPEGAFDQVMARCRALALTLEAIVLTHGHWDHIVDLHRFNAVGIPAYGHRADRVFFENPRIMSPFAVPGLLLEPGTIDYWVAQDEHYSWIGIDWEVREVPGHCPGSIVCYAAAENVAIVGDALFAGSIGRTDLPGGSFAQLEASIRSQIYTLPSDTDVFPGHGPRTTVGREMNTNPYVRA